MPDSSTPYRGRFAPSPTGPLHIGSLIAALASCLDARAQQGSWLVRMDDLDPPREEPGAADSILQSLRCHALHWDEDILYQSHRSSSYQKALDTLQAKGLLFVCDCPRTQLDANGNCSGGCRCRQTDITGPAALRVRLPKGSIIHFTDQLQGQQTLASGLPINDFVVRRKDNLYAYQLAVVVDDAAQGINHVVRGSDLLDTTAKQVFLQQQLGYPTPAYRHLPVITNSLGQKFSKQTHARPLDNDVAADNLRLALSFLNQPDPPPGPLQPAEILSFAINHWQRDRIPARAAIDAATIGVT